ncbi:tlg2 [Candida pseudojiufengensis]|uniref:tlg2 n=1 Tax=Candida pseudojiufengensis TaxID=497109 RepID=UPI0022253DD3|nr:tlg2 [Candida pseudojiufengensis]KAI5958968.1 tlg2 [Candida pseudojiufengensis]
MFRDRTKLFLSYRRTISRDIPLTTSTQPYRDNFNDSSIQDPFYDESEKDTLIFGSRKNKKSMDSEDIEMKSVKPSKFEISNDLNNYLKQIEIDTKDLNSLYKQLIITNKHDKKQLESKIEDLNYKILINFEKCYVSIKKFENLAKNHEKLKLGYNNYDLEILNNLKLKNVSKIQTALIEFRNLQNNYINFLKDEDDELDNLINLKNFKNSNNIDEFSKQIIENTSSNGQPQQQLQQQQQQLQTNDPLLNQREKEINKLAMGILEISTIFKEMSSMVSQQGTLLDRIDYNLTNTSQDLNQANKELIKAQSYQKRSTKCKIIFFLVLCVFCLLLIFMLRPGGGKTKIIEKPGNNDKPTNDKPSDDRPSNERPNDDDKSSTDDSSDNVVNNEINHPNSNIDGTKAIGIELI